MHTVCADISIYGVESPFFDALCLCNMAVDDMNGANFQRANARDMKQRNNHFDFTNTH